MTFAELLEAPAAARCWLLEIDALPLEALALSPSGGFSEAAFSELAFSESDSDGAGALETLRYADRGYTSAAGDSPASTYFEPRLGEDFTLDRRVFGRDGIGGLTRILGVVSLANDDGALDTLLDDYALDGRTVRLRVGSPEAALLDFGTVFSGVVERAERQLGRIDIRVSDGIARLEVPLNPNVYGGTGELEGGADLAGKHRPIVYGPVFNAQALLVDPTLLVYQVHDGNVNVALASIDFVYDRGIAITAGGAYSSAAQLLSVAPGAGTYRAWIEGGYFRLGSAPAGTVSCDVQGEQTGGANFWRAGQIILDVLEYAGLVAAELDSGALSVIGSAFGRLNYWVDGEPVSAAQVIEDLLVNSGSFAGFDRLGVFTGGTIYNPDLSDFGPPESSYTPGTYPEYTQGEIQHIEEVPLPESVNPCVWRVRVGWERNETVQTDLAAGVTDARRAFCAQSERLVLEEDASRASRHRLAREYGPLGNRQWLQASAQTEAVRLLALWTAARRMYRVHVPIAALERDMGELVALIYPRFGLDAGRAGIILGHAIYKDRVELTILV